MIAHVEKWCPSGITFARKNRGYFGREVPYSFTSGVYDVPLEIDREIARLKLGSLGVQIDELTEEQRRYLASWDMGT